MRHFIPRAIAIATRAILAAAQDQQDDPGYDNPCKSYGIDFQHDGTYFQNKSSTDRFSFVSTFEGCQPDMANNILVDPNGDQYQCTDTALQPDDTYQMSTCPLEKCFLWSGAWSVIIISNNGDKGDPIAYQRDFSLEVAVPSTTTYTPTMIISDTTTPVVESTKTTTTTESFTNTKTITSPHTKSKTITQTPKRVTTTKTSTLGTITKRAYTAVPTVITKTKTLTCSVPRRQPTRDPWATITPTIIHAAALETAAPSSSTKATTSGARRRHDARRHVAEGRKEFLAAREARLANALAIEKRGLDNSTVTITELDTSKWATSTSLSTAPASIVTMTEEHVQSVTITSTQTFYSGTTQVVFTITAPTPTKTKTKYTIVKTTSTVTKHPTFTVTIKTAPASSTTICKAKGGKLV